MVWRAAEIVLDDYQTDDPVVTADVTTPDGALKVMGTFVPSGPRTLVFEAFTWSRSWRRVTSEDGSGIC